MKQVFYNIHVKLLRHLHKQIHVLVVLVKTVPKIGKFEPRHIKLIVRQSNVIFSPNPALTVKVFSPLDYTSLGCLEWISSGYQEDILEQFEKSKMAAKMAAIAKKKLNHLILFIKSRVISLFPVNVIQGIHFWGYFCNLRSITRSNIIFKVIYSTIRQY